MINVYKQLEERHLKSKMILQVHDELVLDVYKPELDEVINMIKQTMINALPLDGVPIEVGVDVGENWLEAH
jgi:DNA polymerase-1